MCGRHFYGVLFCPDALCGDHEAVDGKTVFTTEDLQGIGAILCDGDTAEAEGFVRTSRELEVVRDLNLAAVYCHDERVVRFDF